MNHEIHKTHEKLLIGFAFVYFVYFVVIIR